MTNYTLARLAALRASQHHAGVLNSWSSSSARCGCVTRFFCYTLLDELNMSETGEVFDLADWETNNGLNRKTTEALRKEDFITIDVLKAMTPTDIAALGITAGQARALKMALVRLGNAAFESSVCQPQPVSTQATTGAASSPTPEDQDDSARAILQAGEMMDKLYCVQPGKDGSNEEAQALLADIVKNQTPGKTGWGGATGYDPTMLLTVKASTKKALQVTSFVPEAVKQRMAKRRRENLRWSEGPDGTVSLRPDDGNEQVYLSLAEWGAANIRLMHHLMTVAELPRSNIEDYLAYTVMIFDFATKYEWQSVLDFDVRYREQQAEHSFRWGTSAIHLESLLLTSRRQSSGQKPAPKQHYGRRGGNGGRRAEDTGSTDEICRIYAAKGECPYEDRCKFRHVKRA